MSEVVKYSNFEIPRNAIYCQVTSEDSTSPRQNLWIGSASLLWKTSARVLESFVTWDLGSGNEKSADHICLSGLKLILAQVSSVSIVLQASSDNFTSVVVDVKDLGSLETTDLIGADLDAYVSTFTASSTYRYWRIKTTTTIACYHAYRKISFGTFFTFDDRSPQHGYQAPLSPARSSFQTSGGALFGSGSGRRGRMPSFNYNALDDDIRATFEDEILNYAEDVPTFLYEANPSTAKVFSGKGVLLGRIVAAEHSSPNANFNVYTVQVIEDVVS